MPCCFLLHIVCNFFENRVAIKLRTIWRNLWHAGSKNGYKGRFRKREHGALHATHFGHRMVGIKTWYFRGFELSLKPKLAARQRCKWRLVCEWVCTVTSVSVRIWKRAICAKNNKPKSGGLFLVNTRPFPEHSSSMATFSAGMEGLGSRKGVLKKICTNSRKKRKFLFLWLLVQIFFSAPFSRRGDQLLGHFVQGRIDRCLR